MTASQRLRRRLRTWKRRRTVPRKRETSTPRARTSRRPAAPSRSMIQSLVCSLLFTLLVALKLLLPGDLSAFRGTLAQWLVRDADFAEAFAAVGQAAASPGQLTESLANACVAVFGAEEATEVSAPDTVSVPDPRPLPDYASTEQPALPFAYAPPLTAALTSSFGWREDPNTGAERFHTGVDLAADGGTPFAAFADGTVGVVGESTVLGNYLTVLHADGFETLYAHCDAISVTAGQTVSRGETLGTVGATGNATGAHLHFELLSGSLYLDPLPYAVPSL